jgi:protein-tyrosine phosphatase
VISRRPFRRERRSAAAASAENVIEIQPGDGDVAARPARLLLDRHSLADAGAALIVDLRVAPPPARARRQDEAVPGVLHVCTANRCRSAIAERMLRAALPGDVPVTSAGTRARRGEEIWPEAAEELQRRGISPLGFDSHPLTRALVGGADLVLTATRAHRDEVVSGHPAVLRRSFTWREVAWLAGGLTRGEVPGGTASERLAGLAAVLGGRRGSLATPAPHLLDIADPVGGPPGAVEATAHEIEEALRPLVALLV